MTNYFLTALPLMMEPIGCPETSTTNYHSRLRNIPEERRSHLHLGGSLNSRIFALLDSCAGLGWFVTDVSGPHVLPSSSVNTSKKLSLFLVILIPEAQTSHILRGSSLKIRSVFSLCCNRDAVACVR